MPNYTIEIYRGCEIYHGSTVYAPYEWHHPDFYDVDCDEDGFFDNGWGGSGDTIQCCRDEIDQKWEIEDENA